MKELSKKQMKRMKRLRSSIWKNIIICLLADLFIVGFLLDQIYVNMPLSRRQVSTISGVVEYAYARDLAKSHDSLVVQIDGETYGLRWWGNTEELEQYADYLSTKRPSVTLTRMIEPPLWGIIKKSGCTVAISDGHFSYDFSEGRDALMQTNRQICIVLCVLGGLIALPIQGFCIELFFGQEYRELKRKQKKRAMQAEITGGDGFA